MLDIIVQILIGCFACVGVVQVVSWLFVRCNRRKNKIYRVVPVGGEGNIPEEQMSLMYACIQWEANPAGMQTILYDVGIGQENLKECEQLAKSIGVRLVHSPQELETLLRQ